MESIAMWIGLGCALTILVAFAVLIVWAVVVIIREHK